MHSPSTGVSLTHLALGLEFLSAALTDLCMRNSIRTWRYLSKA